MLLQKGFSLLEVGAALLILGLAVTSIFQFISSTTLSAFDLEERAYARQIGINERDGQIDFGGKTFFWSESIIQGQGSDQMNEIRILVSKNKQVALYELRVFIEKK
jgi:prepilin-type N-terminal cleavage/methylation domain-containing protein